MGLHDSLSRQHAVQSVPDAVSKKFGEFSPCLDLRLTDTIRNLFYGGSIGHLLEHTGNQRQ